MLPVASDGRTGRGGAGAYGHARTRSRHAARRAEAPEGGTVR